jgi:AmmeMemoRadiSam system protein B
MKQASIRNSVVAGQFYPGSSQGLKKQIGSFIDPEAQKRNVIACLLPHAGYMYSGRVACQTVSNIQVKEKIVLLGPNHTGFGETYSLMAKGIWQTPLGNVEIDSDLAAAFLEGSTHLQEDSLAHVSEHSLEVELPILQYFKQDFKIVPIAFMSDDLNVLKEIGTELAAVLKESGLRDSTLIVASSDMTHYESQSCAERKDKEAIEAILALDEDRLMERTRRLNISMCGVAPAVVMLATAKALGARSATLIQYQTSGDTTGERDSVVGYAGITIE